MIDDCFSMDRPGLLVSVRSADEAHLALDGGADVIDVKEPSHGSLGAARREVVEAVLTAVADRVPVSVAAGELLDQNKNCSVAAGVAFAKVGLAGCGSVFDWQARWQAAIRRWPTGVASVAVVYADWQRADAPLPDEVLAAALALGCPALLVDTWDKSAGALFDHWSTEETERFCGRVRAAGVATVLAGSLCDETLQIAINCRPNLVAVRGGVCIGGRNGEISVSKMQQVRAALNSTPAACRMFAK